MNFNLEGEFEPERHLVPHEADGRDEQAGPAGPDFFIQIFMTKTNTMTMTMTNKMTMTKTAFDLFI